MPLPPDPFESIAQQRDKLLLVTGAAVLTLMRAMPAPQRRLMFQTLSASMCFDCGIDLPHPAPCVGGVA